MLGYSSIHYNLAGMYLRAELPDWFFSARPDFLHGQSCLTDFSAMYLSDAGSDNRFLFSFYTVFMFPQMKAKMMASMQLAYEDLSIQQKWEEERLKAA
jgi:hypothetical protein